MDSKRMTSLNQTEGAEIWKKDSLPMSEEMNHSAKPFPEEGELSDDDLDSISGGWDSGFALNLPVTAWTSCFNGNFESGFYREGNAFRGQNALKCKNTDHVDERLRLAQKQDLDHACCGNCLHLRFDRVMLVCGKSKRMN